MSKPSKTNKNKAQQPSTASVLPLLEIKDGCVVMKDGTLRAVLMCSSVNFALKSEDEQNATIQAYISFLNSIDFPLQIVIQSRQLNMDGYLKKLAELEKQQPNELLRVQMNEYISYIKELITLGEIMTKRFYIVVSYNPFSDKRRSFWSRVQSVFSAAGTVNLSRDKFAHYAESLGQRVGYVDSGLSSMGVKAVRLDTQGLIELYYNTYNPELKDQQKLVEMEKIQIETN